MKRGSVGSINVFVKQYIPTCRMYHHKSLSDEYVVMAVFHLRHLTKCMLSGTFYSRSDGPSRAGNTVIQAALECTFWGVMLRLLQTFLLSCQVSSDVVKGT